MVFMMPGRATLASTIQIIRKAISAGMNSAILGMRMSAPAAPSSANAETGMSSAAADAESAIALFWDERFILDAQCYLTISATTKPIQSQSLAEGGSHDEDGEHAALDLRLTGHSTRSTQSRQADSKTSADNTETVTDSLPRFLLCRACLILRRITFL